MAQLGRWSSATTSLLPTTSWTAPNGLFGTQDRNDGSAYTFTDSTATLTLPSTGLADGYLVAARVEWEDTSNGRFQPSGRFVQTSGTGNFVSLNSAGYNRDNSEDRSYIHPMGFVDNPSAGATLQFQYSRDTDVPTGGTVRAVLEVYPLYYSNVGVYSSASTSCLGGTTPNLVTGWSSVVESDTAAIELATNQVTLKGDNKRYLIFGGNYWEGIGGSRTQRWTGLRVDSTIENAAKAYSYARNGANDRVSEIYSWLIDRVTTDITVDNFVYRGDGVASGQGGANIDHNTTGSNPAHGLVVLELNDNAEVFRATGSTNQNVATTGPVDVQATQVADIDFNDSASWTRASDTAMNAEVAMDALVGFNISTASQNVGTGQRWTGFAEATVNGTEDTDFFAGDYLRNNQGSQDTFGWSANAVGYLGLSSGDDVGVSVTELPGSEGGGGANHIQSGWAGFWGINLDTLEASGGTDALTADDVESSSEATSPSVGQAHSLIASDVESASAISSPALGQTHSLTASSVESVSEVSSPALADVSSDPSDFVVIHGTAVIPISATSVTIEDGVDYDLESGIASTAWFVRVTNSAHTGQGNTSGGGSRSPNQIAERVSYSGNDITFHRTLAAAGADCRVTYEIVQYVGSSGGPNEFIVRSKEDAAISAGSTSTTVSVPVSVVDSSNVVPFISCQGSSAGGSGQHEYHATVTLNGSNFDVVRGGTDGNADYSLSLVEFTGSNWTVQAHEFVGSGTNSTTTFSTAVADVNETFIYTTFNYDNASHGVDDVSRRVSLDSTTQLRYESQTATGAADKNHTTYIVENPEMTVTRYSGTMSGTGVEEVDDVTITSVVVGRTMTTLSNDTTGTGTAFPNGYISHELIGSTTLRLRQSRDDQTARYSFETIELPLSASADALTADDVESASEVTSPSIGQEHALTSTDVESASEVTSPAVGQAHALTATSVESASEVSSPTLGQSESLSADDVESSSEVTSPALGQVHSLSADDTESATEVSTPALGQEHGLLADDVETGSEVGAPSLGQVHDLSADDVESASQVSTPGLSTEGTDGLSADSVESASEVSSPALGQVHSLTADDVQSVTEVSAPTLAETQALFANDVESLSEVSSPVLGQVHALLANDVESRSEVSAPGLDGAEEPEDIGAVPHEEKLKDYDRRAKERLAAELERLQEEKAVEKRKAKPSRIPQLDAEIAALEAEMQQMAIDAANEEIARIQEEQRRAEELRAREEEEAVAILLLM